MLMVIITVASFGNNTKETATTVPDGKRLFAAKSCSACHNETIKVVGPSIKEINAIYAKKEGDIFAFLKEKSDAIVDTDPGQVAIMKSNIDTILKDISDTDLKAIITYMKSIE